MSVIRSRCNEGVVKNLHESLGQGLLDMFRDSQYELILHHNPKLGTSELNKTEGK